MAVERQNPLPVGTYWVDVPHEQLAPFQAWTLDPRVRVLKTRETARRVTWFLFQTTMPGVMWKGPGLPTIATPDTEHSDTRSRPDPPQDPLDQLSDFGASLGSGLGLLLVLWLLSKR